ncbi:unnamed protein product, partial [Vitis vinifera]
MPIPFILKVSYLEKPYVSYTFEFSMMHSRSKSEKKASIFPCEPTFFTCIPTQWQDLFLLAKN